MGKKIEMVGYEFSGCVVIKEIGRDKDKKVTWLCICNCGNEFIATGKHIRTGDVKSCGCYKRSVMSGQGIKNKTHGQSKTRLYSIWHGMKKRCALEGDTSYKNYGGKGISVCDDWKESFESFRDWSLLNGYTDKLTIDRIDSTGNYTPENCRWANWNEQARNRSNNSKVVYKGKLITQSEVAELAGISKELVYYRKNNGIDYDKPKSFVKESDLHDHQT